MRSSGTGYSSANLTPATWWLSREAKKQARVRDRDTKQSPPLTACFARQQAIEHFQKHREQVESKASSSRDAFLEGRGRAAGPKPEAKARPKQKPAPDGPDGDRTRASIFRSQIEFRERIQNALVAEGKRWDACQAAREQEEAEAQTAAPAQPPQVPPPATPDRGKKAQEDSRASVAEGKRWDACQAAREQEEAEAQTAAPAQPPQVPPPETPDRGKKAQEDSRASVLDLLDYIDNKVFMTYVEKAPPPATAKAHAPGTATEPAKAWPSPEEIERIKAEIAVAETVEEVERLERALKCSALCQPSPTPDAAAQVLVSTASGKTFILDLNEEVTAR